MDAERIDRALSDSTASGHVPGIAAIAVNEAGTVYQGAFGRRSLAGDAPMTLDTVAWIASMTKPITTTAAMQLVERGKLSLEQPAGEVVPALRDLQVLEGIDAAGKEKLRPAKRPVTLRHLLTHTSGLSYEFLNPLMAQYKKAREIPPARTCRDVALRVPLVFEPGERWEYGIGIDWAGKMVEAASGQRLDAYLAEHVLGPLGMKSTAFRISPDMRARKAAVHQRNPEGALRATEFEINQEPEFHMGGGGLYGTAEDYARFMRMILNRGTLDGARILEPATVERMATNHIGDLVIGDMISADRTVANDVPAIPSLPMKWGLGFMINTVRLPGGRSAGSLSWSGLANSHFWIDPAKKLAGVFVAQLLPFYDLQVMKAFRDFESGVYR